MMLTGISVNDEQFAIINDIYMLAGDDFDKERFCEDYKKHGDSTLMYRFYISFKYATEEVEKVKAKLAEEHDEFVKAKNNADMYHGWWIDETNKIDALKKEHEEEIVELNREHTSFKDDALDAIKFIAGQL